jgi:hypothetical protein
LEMFAASMHTKSRDQSCEIDHSVAISTTWWRRALYKLARLAQIGETAVGRGT